MQKQKWIPEICYEESGDGITSSIPFIDVPPGQSMPAVLFIFESKRTGNFEPNELGEESPIVELDLFQYGNLKLLKEKLSPGLYDEVRLALGLERLKDAVEKGKNLNKEIN